MMPNRPRKRYEIGFSKNFDKSSNDYIFDFRSQSNAARPCRNIVMKYLYVNSAMMVDISPQVKVAKFSSLIEFFSLKRQVSDIVDN